MMLIILNRSVFLFLCNLSQGPVQFPPSPPARRLNNIRELPHPYPKLKIKGQLTRPNNRAQFTELVDVNISFSAFIFLLDLI